MGNKAHQGLSKEASNQTNARWCLLTILHTFGRYPFQSASARCAAKKTEQKAPKIELGASDASLHEVVESKMSHKKDNFVTRDVLI